MLCEEIFTTDTGIELVRHYSDIRHYIEQIETGAIYEDAVDVIPCKYTYRETDEEIPEPEPIPEPEQQEQEVLENDPAQ